MLSKLLPLLLFSSNPSLSLDADQLMLVNTTRFGDERVLQFQQVVHGIPVEDRIVSVTLDADDRVTAVHSDITTEVNVPAVRPDIGEHAAREAASAHLDWAPTLKTRKVVLAMGHLAEVCWRVTVARVPMVQHYYVYVSEATGRVLRVVPAMRDMPHSTSIGGAR